METKTTIFLLSAGLCLTPFLLTTTPACSSSDTGTTSSSSGGTGKTATASVVTGAADSHCTDTTTVDPAMCHAAMDAGDTDAGDTDGGMDMGGDFGATLYGGEGDDDDCKYHVKWSAASGKSAADYSEVNFTAVITTKVDGKAVAGGPVDIEAFDANNKPPLNTDGKTTEATPGTYTVPVRFAPTASGKWTIRFHIHGDCDDTPEGPHGHAAFFVQIDIK